MRKSVADFGSLRGIDLNGAMEEKDAGADDCGGHGDGRGIEHERVWRGRIKPGEGGKGAGEDDAWLQAGLTDSSFIFGQDIVRDGDGEHTQQRSLRAHGLKGDEGVVDVKREKFFEAKADDLEGFSGLGWKGVEVEEKDADGGVRDDDGDVAGAIGATGSDAIEGAAEGDDDSRAVGQVAGFEAGQNGAGAKIGAGDSGERARGRLTACGNDAFRPNLTGEAGAGSDGGGEKAHA